MDGCSFFDVAQALNSHTARVNAPPLFSGKAALEYFLHTAQCSQAAPAPDFSSIRMVAQNCGCEMADKGQIERSTWPQSTSAWPK